MSNVWIFQSNPKYYDLIRDLGELTRMESGWPIRQQKNKIEKGDLALLWVSGENRGIYATADIISKPKMEKVDFTDSWVNPKRSADGKTEELMVELGPMTILKPPLLESELKQIRELFSLSIMRQHNGTNFPVTESEWDILSKEIEKRTLTKYEEIFTCPEYFTEGKEREIIQTIYERNSKLREMAIKMHGTTCSVCGFNFAKKYGILSEGYIEIHHLVPHSEHKIKGESEINPETDLIPLCSNCHRIIHKPEKMLSIEELKKIVKS
ncbi:HNH endonuclease [Methanoregula boonei 6A8]|uniref:HNH endonuclease n=1 Tax=Methanoregula boonei (strain DSM 21154 / JCM 14090 / 6A8) TaxID=456442 RepID=A7I926_METB6|nr:EVE domain-containing protein [Methanoregula boonei]ABS56237.1 HNH endonuclease [Methanoregula boonei 6A8]